jgi:hypothetical protein
VKRDYANAGRTCPRCGKVMQFDDVSLEFPLCLACVQAVSKPTATEDYRVRTLRRELGDGYRLLRARGKFLLIKGDRVILGPTSLKAITHYVLRYRFSEVQGQPRSGPNT